MVKRCNRCGSEKDLDEFNRHAGQPDGRQRRCRECDREIGNAYYARNREKARASRVEYRRKVRQWVLDYLAEHPCVDCGEDDLVVLEFDHDDPATKLANIADLIRRAGIPAVVAEVKKCSVRCANCHRRRTAEQFGFFHGSLAEVD